MTISREEIQEKTFKPAFKGYNKVEVEVFLEHIAGEVEKILAENAELKQKFEKIDGEYQKFYKEKEQFSAEQIKAKKEIEKIKKETQKSCEQIKTDARFNAQEMLKDSYITLKGIKKDIDDLKKIKESFVKRYHTYLRDQLESIKLFQREKFTDDKK